MEKEKKKYKLVIIFFILSAFAFVLITMLFNNFSDKQSLEKVINLAKDYVQIEDVSDSQKLSGMEGTEAIAQSVNVNFEKLCEKNEDIVGWIYIPDTSINYPILKSDDNDYYLTHDSLKKTSHTGSIFLDKSHDMLSQKKMIYGHNMKDNSMFGSLKKYQDADFLKKHPYIYLFNLNNYFIYEIKSVDNLLIEDDLFNTELYNCSYSNAQKELYLCTCNNDDTKRLIIKAIGLSSERMGKNYEKKIY